MEVKRKPKSNRPISGILFLGKCRICGRYFETCSTSRKHCNRCVVERRGIEKPSGDFPLWPLLWEESEATRKENERIEDGKKDKKVLVRGS